MAKQSAKKSAASRRNARKAQMTRLARGRNLPNAEVKAKLRRRRAW